MTKLSNQPTSGSDKLYERIRKILESARSNVARTVNTTQVVANWLIGREIVDHEQGGKQRAGYGKSVLKNLAGRLREEFGAGYSVDNLEWFRAFFLAYPNLLEPEKSDAAPRISAGRRKSDAMRRISDKLEPDQPSWIIGQLSPNLSWTHYRSLVRVESAPARAFYEIEAVKNNWSARELERQINSLLYERLAMSKDKAGLMKLATKGQEIATPPMSSRILSSLNFSACRNRIS